MLQRQKSVDEMNAASSGRFSTGQPPQDIQAHAPQKSGASLERRKLYFITFLLGATFLAGPGAFSQTSGPPLANNIQDTNRSTAAPFAEERLAAQDFISHVNEARQELALKQVDLARDKIISARHMLPIIMRATPVQRRLTRVEFGGGFYADDMSQRKSYFPIETQSLETLTRPSGPRWVKNTRSESNAVIIYITLNLSGGKAQTYLDQAEKDILAKKTKDAEVQLEKLSDLVIRIDDSIPAVIQARDYITLADNYILAGNFFGARYSLEKAAAFLDDMRDKDIYRPHHADIVSLRKEIDDLEAAFAQLDADQIKTADIRLRKWQQQLTRWAEE